MRLFIVLALFASSVSAFAETAPVKLDPVPAAPPAPLAKPAKVCRISQEPTGSHMGGSGRVCRTAEAWARIDNREASGQSAGPQPVQSGSATMQ